jgi:hypothetical protein
MMIVLLVVSFHGRSAVSAQTVRSRKVELAIETP